MASSAFDRGTILVPQDVEMASNETEDETVPLTDIKRQLLDDFDSEVKLDADKHSGDAGLDTTERGHMCVYLRIRPLNETERLKGEDQGCMELLGDHTLIMHAPEDSHTFKSSMRGTSKAHHKFTFSKIFPQDTAQKEFFDDTMLGTVKDFIDGQNCLIFTYGVTNSGKTYTIQGSLNDAGILPRSLDVIFNSISGKQMEDMSLKPKLFCDVARLTPGQTEKEQSIKEGILKLADIEEPDMTALMGHETDASAMTSNSTISEDSLNRHSLLSTASSKHSIDSLDKTALQDILEESRLREDAAVDVELQGPIRFSIWVSFMEIYNDQIFDLLDPPPKKKNMRRNVLQLKEDKNGVPYVRGLKEVHVTNADEAYKILVIGKKNLQIACTKLNHNSSRSHCVFTVKIVRVVDKNNPKMARISMLSFCDLAGSERHSKTGSIGDRMKEAGNINASLLTLGRCIKTLRYNQMNKDHPRIVPFRESKLTRIFQSFFCGKGRASMVVNVNQCASLFDETLHALKYSAIAKQVVVVQEAPPPPPPKPEPEAEKKSRNKRLDTLLLEQQSGLSRASVAWATPGSLAKIFDEEEKAANVRLPDDSLEEDGAEEYLDIIEDLKQQLVEEKRKNRKLEREIRAEVSQEMAQQLVMIEEAYSERMRDALECAEEKHDKRIEILTKSIRKAAKRKRDPDDDDEYVPSVTLHATQVKLQEKEAELQELKLKLLAVDKQIASLTAEQRALQEKCSKLTFDNSSKRAALDDATSMLDEIQTMSKEIQEELGTAEKRVRERDARIAELEAALEGKACTTCQLMEEQLEQKEDQLTKTQQMIDMMNCEMSDKLRRIEELEVQTTPTESRDAQAEVNHVDTQTDEVDSEKTVEMQQELDRLQTELKEKEDCILAANERFASDTEAIKQILQTEMNNLQEELTEVTNKLKDSEENTADLESQLQSVKEQLEQKTSELKRLSTSADLNAAMKERLDCLQEEADETRATLTEQKSKHGREIKQLNSQLQDLETALQVKELDLTTRGTEMFEALEQRTELEGEVATLKEALANEKQEKKLTVEALEMLRSKLITMEAALDDASKQGDKNDELCKEVEDLKGSLAEKSAELEAARTELGGLRRSLSDVTDLEESLHQANQVVRQKSQAELELFAKIKEAEADKSNMQESIDKLQTEIKEKEQQIKEFSAETNEWESKYGEEREKLQKLSEKLATVEVELGIMRAERAREMNEATAASDTTVKALKASLASEKQDHSAQLSQLRSTLAEKTAKLEKSQSELVKVRANLEGEHKEQLELRSKVVTLEGECHTLKRQLKQEKEQTESIRADMSKLELKLHESEARLQTQAQKRQDLETQAQTLQENVTELTLKVSELEEAVREGEETEAELQETQARLEQTLQERERLLATISALEEQLTQLTSQSGAAAAADIEQLENLRCEMKALQKALDDAEYKHQMAARQTRREKSQMDKLLQETESAAREAEDRVCELESELSELRAALDKRVADTVTQHKTRAEKLEDIVRDLEHCLCSSKESEAKLCSQNDEYRAKFREQEKRLADLEDSLKELQDARDTLVADHAHDRKCAQSMMSDKQQQIEEYKGDIKALHDLIDRNAHDFARQMYDKNVRIAQLEEEVEMLRHQADDSQLHSKIHALQQRLSQETADAAQAATRADRLEAQLGALREDAKSSNARVIVLQRGLEAEREAASQHTQDNRSLRSQVETLTAERDNRCAEITQLKEQLCHEQNTARDLSERFSDLETRLAGAQQQEASNIAELRRQLRETQEQLNETQLKLSESQSSLQLTNEKLSQLQLDWRKAQKTDRDRQSKMLLLEENLKDCEQELTKTQEQVRNLKTELKNTEQNTQARQELETTNRKLADLEKELEENQAMNTELKTRCDELEAKHQSVEQELKRKSEELVVLTEEKMSSQESLVSVKGKCSELQEKLSSLEKETESLQESKSQEIARIQEKMAAVTGEAKQVSKLRRELEEMREARSSMEHELQALRNEAAARETSCERYSAQINLLKQEADIINQQLKHSQGKESELRGQMREAKAEMDERNVRLTALEGELRSQKATADDGNHRVNDLQSQINTLKEQVDKQTSQLKEKDQEVSSLKSSKDSLNLELRSTKLDLERKEKRLETKTKKIETLREENEKARNEYEKAYNVVFSDSQANARALETLKNTLEEQDQVMSNQDVYIKKKEEEVAALSTDLDSLTRRYETLLKESAEKSTQVRQVDKLNKQLSKQEGELEEMRSQLASVTATVDKLQQENVEAETALAKSDAELKKMEAELADTRSDRESLRRQLDSSVTDLSALKQAKEELVAEHKQGEKSRTQAEQLRTKFLALEEHNKQLEKEKEHFKDQCKAQEERKEKELQKWRENRDKLVGQLQVILSNKEKQIKELEAAQGKGQSVDVAKLKQELAERDSTIAQLYSQLENGGGGAPKTRGSRGTRSTRQDFTSDGLESMDALTAELASMRQQVDGMKASHERELGNLRFVKDEVISALKHQNKQLEKQLPAAQYTPAVVISTQSPMAISTSSLPPPKPSRLYLEDHGTAAEEARVEVEEENMAIQCSLSESPAPPEKPPTGKTRNGKKSRGNKRLSAEMEKTNLEDESMASSSRKSRGTGGKRKSSRRTTKTASVCEESRVEEQVAVGMLSVREEDVVDLSMIHNESSNFGVSTSHYGQQNYYTRAALHNSTNLDDNSHMVSSTPKTDNRHATFISPAHGDLTAPPTTGKKKRRLRNAENESPFADEPSNSHPAEAEKKADAHKIVKRSLRSRKR